MVYELPEPTGGGEVVSFRLKRDFCKWIDDRSNKGIDKYGMLLRTFNGRDAYKDRMMEILDFCQYQEQQIMELETLNEALIDYLNHLDRWSGVMDPEFMAELQRGIKTLQEHGATAEGISEYLSRRLKEYARRNSATTDPDWHGCSPDG